MLAQTPQQAVTMQCNDAEAGADAGDIQPSGAGRSSRSYSVRTTP